MATTRTRSRSPKRYQPTPIAARFDKPRNRKVAAAKVVGAAALTGGAAYLGYRHRGTISATYGVYAKHFKSSSVGKSLLKGKITARLYKQHVRHFALPRAKATARYVRYSHKPFTVGYKSGRMAGWNPGKSAKLGGRNMYQAHKPHVMRGLNKAANAYQGYRRVRRDYRGRFKGWM